MGHVQSAASHSEPDDMTIHPEIAALVGEIEFDPDALLAKYLAERDKRLRPDEDACRAQPDTWPATRRGRIRSRPPVRRFPDGWSCRQAPNGLPRIVRGPSRRTSAARAAYSIANSLSAVFPRIIWAFSTLGAAKTAPIDLRV